mgnify:FL=1
MENKQTIKNYFDNGDRPTEPQMHDFIIGTVNLEEPKSQHIQDVLCLASGSNEIFDTHTPPFVPFLQDNVKIQTLDSNVMLHHSASEGFADISSGITSMWNINGSNSAIFRAKSDDSDFIGGAIELITGTVDQDRTCVTTNNECFRFGGNTPLWAKIRFKTPTWINTKWQFGFTETDDLDQAAGALDNGTDGQDKVIFQKQLGNSANPRIRISKDNEQYTQTLAGGGSPTLGEGDENAFDVTDNNRIITLGIWWDGNKSGGKIRFFGDSVPSGTEPRAMKELYCIDITDNTTYYSLEKMKLFFYSQSVSGNNQDSTIIEYIQGAQYVPITH